MNNSSIFIIYLITLLICTSIAIVFIMAIQKGLKRYYEDLSHNTEISTFFLKMTNIILILGGTSAALSVTYSLGKDSDWLKVVWEIADQLQKTLSAILTIAMILIVVFLFLHIWTKRMNR